MKAILCQKWELPIYTPCRLQTDIPLRRKTFDSHVVKSASWISDKVSSIYWLCGFLPKGCSVIEYFGGVGLSSLLLQETVKPARHTIYEIEDELARHLKLAFPNAAVYHQDAFLAMLEQQADIYTLDYIFTPSKVFGKYDKHFRHIFSTKPLAVLLTDTAPSYLMIHYRKYSALFGLPIQDLESYTEAYSTKLFEQYGYSIVKAAHRRRAAYYLLLPGKNSVEHRYFKNTEIDFRLIDESNN